MPKSFLLFWFIALLLSFDSGACWAKAVSVDGQADSDKSVSFEADRAEKPTCQEHNQVDVLCLDLNRALAITLANNRTIKSAYLSRVSDKYSLYVAQDLFIPDLNIILSGTTEEAGESVDRIGTDTLSTSYGLNAFLPTGGQLSLSMSADTSRANNRAFGERGRTSSSNVNLSFVQPLLRGAGYKVARSSLQIAEISEKGNILGLKALLIDTLSETILAYRTYQLELKQLAITETSLLRARALVATTQSLIDAGRVAPVELVQAEVTVAQRELSFESAKNAVDNARLSLLSVLDINLDTDINLIEQETLLPQAEWPTESLFNTALKNQPSYLQSLLSLEISEIDMRLARNNRLWDLDATFSAGLNGNRRGGFDNAFDDLRRNQLDLRAGLALTIPFGDRTRRQGVINARVNQHQQELAVIELKESLKISVVNQQRTVRSLWAQLRLARQSEALVEKQLDTENIRLNLGRSTNFRVVEFEDQLIIAQLDTASITTAYLNALTELDRLLGTSLETWDISFQAQRYNAREIKNVRTSAPYSFEGGL